MKTWINPSSRELHIFKAIHQVVKKHTKIIDYMFDPKNHRLCADPKDILYEAGILSSSEFLLLQVALDMWSASGNTQIYDLLVNLDEENFINVLNGLLLLRNSNYRVQNLKE